MASRRDKEKREMQYQSARERAEKHEKQFEPTSLQLPEGTELFSFDKARTYRLDLLPFKPKRTNDYVDAGFWHYEWTYFRHTIPTAKGVRNYCCLQSFGKPCPICEELSKLERSGSTDAEGLKKMKAKERQLFNLIDLDNKDKSVQIFEFNHWQFGKHLDEKVSAKAKYDGFYHLEGGRTLEVTTEKNVYDGRTTYKPKEGAFEFEERPDYDEKILDEVHQLDDLPKEYSYKELKKIFLQGSQEVTEDDEETDSEEPDEDTEEESEGSSEEDEDRDLEEGSDRGQRGGSTKKTTFKVGDWVTYKGERMTVKKIRDDGLLVLEGDDEDTTYGRVDPKAVKKIVTKEDEEEDRPTGRARTASKKTAGAKPRSRTPDEEEEQDLDTDEDEDEDLDELEDEEEEEDMEDDDESEDDEDLDDEEEPAARKKTKGKRR